MLVERELRAFAQSITLKEPDTATESDDDSIPQTGDTIRLEVANSPGNLLGALM